MSEVKNSAEQGASWEWLRKAGLVVFGGLAAIVAVAAALKALFVLLTGGSIAGPDLSLTDVGVLAALAFVYFIPTLTAWKAKHHQLQAIAILNTLLGWTILGWIAALVWAAMKPAKG